MRAVFLCWCLFAPLGYGFQSDDVLDLTGLSRQKEVTDHIVSAPKPRYPDAAKSARSQGMVVLEVLVDERGVPTTITLIHATGPILNQAAAGAVRQWRYTPFIKDGKPVKAVFDVTVAFYTDDGGALQTVAKREAAINIALRGLQQNRLNPAIVESLRDLATQKDPAGMYLYGLLLEQGRSVEKDPARGFQLIQDAAGKDYGPALYEVGLAEIKGDRLPEDRARGVAMVQRGAKLGSAAAQLYLGDAFEKGDGVAKDREKSQQYFRSCATADTAACQLRLAESLLDEPGRPDRDYIQAIAWLQLASEHGLSGAAAVLEREGERLTPAQIIAVDKLKPQLVQKH